jgi:hypothetical protein
MPVVRMDGTEQIEGNRMLDVGGIEIYDIIHATGRDVVEKFTA